MYKPNFNNAKVRNRVSIALGMSIGCFSYNDPREMSTRFIDKHFQQQQKPISRYLRDILLICVDEYYSKSKHQSKKYILNNLGVSYIKYMMDNPNSPYTWEQWKKGSNTVASPESAKNNSQNVDNSQVEDIISSHTLVYTLEDSVGQIIEHNRNDKMMHDVRYVKYLLNKEIQQQLVTGDIEYKEKSNRLWNPLQNVRKEYKVPYLAEHGYIHIYDIETCAPTLILQYARSLGFSKPVPHYQNYLDNKQTIRYDLAKETGLELSRIKVMINALFNSARLDARDNASLYYTLHKDKAIIKYLQQHDTIISLRNDIRKVWYYIRNNLPGRHQEYVDMTTGEIIPSNIKKLSPSDKWSIYFELEHYVMRSVRQYLKNTDNIHFLEHDGWTCKDMINIDDLKQYVYDNTNYRINLDYSCSDNTTNDSLPQSAKDDSQIVADGHDDGRMVELDVLPCARNDSSLLSSSLSSPILGTSFLKTKNQEILDNNSDNNQVEDLYHHCTLVYTLEDNRGTSVGQLTKSVGQSYRTMSADDRRIYERDRKRKYREKLKNNNQIIIVR